LVCWKAPPSTVGFLAITANRLNTALPIAGVNIWVDPSAAQLILLPISVGTSGTFNAPLPLPSGLMTGTKAHVQCIWANTAACGGAGTNSASDALEVSIQ
jgi:hypothetical protein